MFVFLIDLFKIKRIEDPKIKYSLEAIENFVDENINNMLISSLDELGKTHEEVVNLRRRKEVFRSQLDLCGLGDIAAKQFIKSWISDLITQKYNVSKSNINYAINFNKPNTYDKFCILTNEYFKEYRYDAIKEFIYKNKLDKLKNINDEEMYAVTIEDIEDIYEKEMADISDLSFSEKLDILVQRIYEDIQGLSVIDEIRDMNSDGISFGVSGIPIDFESKISDINIKSGIMHNFPMSYDSIWLYLGTKEISLNFMTFGSQRQLERVCRKIYRFNNNKQFTKDKGYIFNNMADISRATVFRPPYSESWAGFIRKFDYDGTLEDMITGINSEIVIGIITYLMKSKRSVCFSGDQGAGKTTMLIASARKLYATSTIRVWESYFETFFRFKMPFRNVLTVRETEEIKGETALDSMKKSNGKITIVSESADDFSKAYVIKGALAASECVEWTDHSISEDELVETHRNALLNIGLFRDEDKAEEQVLRVLKWNVHLGTNEELGLRYIKRVTEFIRLDDKAYVDGNDERAFHQNSKMFFERKTNAKKYKTVNLIEYDEENRKYVIKNNFSEQSIKLMKEKLRKKDQLGFKLLLDQIEEQVKGEQQA